MRRGWRLSRAHIAFGHDVVMAGVSFVAALYLRLGNDIFRHAEPYLLEGTLLFAAIAAVVFNRTGVYRGVWRYASLPDLYALAKAVTLTVLIFLPALFLFSRAEDYPRSALVINWFVLMALLGGILGVAVLVRSGRRGTRPYGPAIAGAAVIITLL